MTATLDPKATLAAITDKVAAAVAQKKATNLARAAEVRVPLDALVAALNTALDGRQRLDGQPVLLEITRPLADATVFYAGRITITLPASKSPGSYARRQIVIWVGADDHALGQPVKITVCEGEYPKTADHRHEYTHWVQAFERTCEHLVPYLLPA